MSAEKKTGRACAVAICVGSFTLGCAPHYTVTRVVDGQVREGDFVEPQAYAAYLRGAIAEAHGDDRVALKEYESAAKIDDADPEIWTRVAAVRCKIDPRDDEAREAITRALVRDEEYAPAWEVRASCEVARGVDRENVERAAMRAAEIDPRSPRAQALLANVEAQKNSHAARARLIALTLLAGDDAEAWSALGFWSAGAGDADLQRRAFSRVATLAPTKWKLVADAVTRLAGEGALAEARSLAGVLADAERRIDRASSREKFSIAHELLPARLAVDDAIIHNDLTRAEERASTGRVSLEEVTARAVLLGEPNLARDLASSNARADPENFSARVALASADPAFSSIGATSMEVSVPASLFFAFRSTHSADAIAFASEPIVAGDALVDDVAAKLAVRGVVDRKHLSPEAEIEADVRSRKIPRVTNDVDVRHRLLAIAFQPKIPDETATLVTRLARVAPNDLFVALARANLEIHSGRVEHDSGRKLLALAPNDPFVVATAGALNSLVPSLARGPEPSFDIVDPQIADPKR